MKKEDLLELGLSEEQIKGVMSMAGRDVERHKMRIAELTQERDQFNAQLETANETLTKFDGIDLTKIKDEIESYKQRAAKAESDYKAKLQDRDQRDWLGKKFDAYGVKSPYARKQLEAEAMGKESGLSWKDGAFFGFDDFMAAAKKNDAGLYETEEEKAAAAKAAEDASKNAESAAKQAPSFVRPTGDGEGAERKYTPPKIF